GSFMLDFSGGARVPIPTVAPEARLLSAATDPAVPLSFVRDSADNWFAVAEDPPDAPVRLTMLVDAPKGHFNMSIPDLPADVLASHVPPMPRALEESALAFAHDLGIERDD